MQNTIDNKEQQEAREEAQKHSCQLTPEQKTPKLEGKVKILIRRAVEQVKPTKCSIRYDANTKMWGVLDKELKNYIRHFTHGVMTNVVFEASQNYAFNGCSGGTMGWMGIATGDLQENYYGADSLGYHNLNFGRDGKFHGDGGETINSVKVLRLFSDRKSLYK